MKINVYLPDDIGAKAKANPDINCSGLLRQAVEDELSRLEAQADLLDGPEEFVLDLLDDDGRGYKGRFTGTLLSGEGDAHAYLAEHDEHGPRILIHDQKKERIQVLDKAADLEHWLAQDDYQEVMHQLGETPVIDI